MKNEKRTEWKVDGEFHSVTCVLVDRLEGSDSRGKQVGGHGRSGFESGLCVREEGSGSRFEKNGRGRARWSVEKNGEVGRSDEGHLENHLDAGFVKGGDKGSSEIRLELGHYEGLAVFVAQITTHQIGSNDCYVQGSQRIETRSECGVQVNHVVLFF